MRKNYMLVLLVLFLLNVVGFTSTPDPYNITWDSPSKDYNGSMPLGNGDIGLNVWVEESGDLCFYIGKTDSWSENGRLLKVGKIRIKTNPSVCFDGAQFEQVLDLKTATMTVKTSGILNGKKISTKMDVWVDAHNPVIYIQQHSSIPIKMTAQLEPWRTEREALPSLEVSDLLEDRTKPGSLHKPVFVEPDILIKNKDYIGWYHFNEKSIGFDLTNKLQGLDNYFQTGPLKSRIFGAVVTGSNTHRIDDKTLQTASAKTNLLGVFVLTQHPSTPEKWMQKMENIVLDNKVTFEQNKKEHQKWWADFWDKSWLIATDSTPNLEKSDAFIVTRAYALQRFVDAAAGRGNYPIKFNGSIFTVPSPDNPGNADYRRWGPGYWWQNTRLPYLSMCTSGDWDLLQPFFNLYADTIFKTNLYRTKKYFGFDGAYYPECVYFWGSVFTSTYGWEPYAERDDPLQEGGWHKWEWVAGPELVFMMLDYYDYTQDQEFLKIKILPVANAVLQFFDEYYETKNGKLYMHPSQAVETWWDCVNPMPELSGMYAVLKRLLDLPQDMVVEKDQQFWKILFAKLPPIPLRDTESGKALAPAEKFADKRNVENPELYAVFPFRLFAVGNNHLDWGINALKHRWDKGNFGWRQDDIFMAYMGLVDEAKSNLVGRAKSYHTESRFPVFWGPNYDWVPDQDHGGVLMKAFQSMLIQADPYSDKIYLLPAWPKEWNGEFKLHAPNKTILQGKIKDGNIYDLIVTPESRLKDVVFWNTENKQ